jgi:WD40 repeat protein
MVKLKVFALICIAVFVTSFQPIAVGRSENDGLACELATVFEDEDADLIQWSPDGNYLLNTGRGDSRISIWDMESGTRIKTLGMPNDGPSLAVAWRADGQQIATIHPLYNVTIWDLAAEEIIADFETYEAIDQEVYEQNLYSLSWHPDGDILAIVHDLNISLLDLQTGDLNTIYHSYEIPHNIFGAAQVLWIDDGSRLAVANTDGTVSFLNTDNPSQLVITQDETNFSTSPVSRAYSMSFNADRTVVAIAGYSGLTRETGVILYDVESLEQLSAIDIRNGDIFHDYVTAIGWSATQDILAIGHETELTINTFDDDFAVSESVNCGSDEGVRSLMWHPSENLLASVDWDGDIRFWRVEND